MKKFVIPLIISSIIISLTACGEQGKEANNDIPYDYTEQVGNEQGGSSDPVSPAGSTDEETATDNIPDTSGNNGGIVELNGNYIRFDGIKGFDGDYEYLAMIGEADGNIIMEYLPPSYSEEDKPSLMLVDLNTLEVRKSVEMESSIPDSYHTPVSHTKMAGDKVIVCFREYVSVMDKSLEPIDKIQLPESIISISKREETYDDDYRRITYYGGYDISSDLKKIVYVDETGIKQYDLKTGKETLLVRNIHNEDILKGFEFWTPRFIADDKKVIVNKLGYEYSLGYAICSIDDQSLQMLNLFTQDSMNDIYYDTGLLEPGVSTYYDDEDDDSEWKRFYYDFRTGKITEIPQDKVEYIRYIFRDNAYVGENYAAFATYVWDDDNDENETKNDMYYINRFNLKTLETENEILAIKGGGPYIFGVLADGRVLFRYTYKDSESGVCIAK